MKPEYHTGHAKPHETSFSTMLATRNHMKTSRIKRNHRSGTAAEIADPSQNPVLEPFSEPAPERNLLRKPVRNLLRNPLRNLLRNPLRNLLRNLLKKARQVRKKAKARLARGGRTTFSGRVKLPKPENQTGRTSRRATEYKQDSSNRQGPPRGYRRGGAASVQSLAEAASHPEPQDEQGQEPMEPTRPPLAGETAYHYVQPVPSGLRG